MICFKIKCLHFQFNRIFGFRVNEGPSASRVALYNPFIFPRLYAKFDEKFRQVCCLDSTLCDVYHSRRPRLFCYNSCPYFIGKLIQLIVSMQLLLIFIHQFE